jgi:DNA-binding MarR family transcriptional regulator
MLDQQWLWRDSGMSEQHRVPSDRPDATGLAAYRTFITAHAEVITEIERRLAVAEVIPLTWYDVLIELYEAHDRRLRLHELARAVVLSRSTLTRTVDRLESAGLLRREPDPTDRRGAFAVLTDEGLEAMRKAWPYYAQGIVDTFTRHVSEDEARVISEVCARIRDAAREPAIDRRS